MPTFNDISGTKTKDLLFFKKIVSLSPFPLPLYKKNTRLKLKQNRQRLKTQVIHYQEFTNLHSSIKVDKTTNKSFFLMARSINLYLSLSSSILSFTPQYMKQQVLHIACLVIGLLGYATALHAQTGIVAGTLADSNGEAIPFVNIMVEGTANGTQSDFDGNYQIKCKVGDVLVFQYIGWEDKSIIVTADMFADIDSNSLNRKPSNRVQTITVNPIEKKAYSEKIKSQQNSSKQVIDISTSPYRHNESPIYKTDNIKSIEIDSNQISFTRLKKPLHYSIKYQQNSGIQFAPKSFLPSLQNQYAQGQPINGSTTWQGAELNEIFSFGPAINTLAFDGTPYDYDDKGALIPANTSTNQTATAKAYQNKLLYNSTNIANSLSVKLLNDKHQWDFKYLHQFKQDIFNEKNNQSNSLSFNYLTNNSYPRNVFKFFVHVLQEKNRQPNINGFHNQLLLNHYLSPASFSNQQGYALANSSQRSFAPQHYNNPVWLLKTHQNNIRTSQINTGSHFTYSEIRAIKLIADINYQYQENQLQFALPKNTIGFAEGYKSNKVFKEQNAYAKLQFQWRQRHYNKVKFAIHSQLLQQYEHLDYTFTEQTDFPNFSFNNPSTENTRLQTEQKYTAQWLNKMEFMFARSYAAKLILQNNAFFSSRLPADMWQPSISSIVDVANIFEQWNWLNHWTISGGYAQSLNDVPLFYNNYSHNSLRFRTNQSLHYTANEDLFINDNLRPQKTATFEVETNLKAFRNKWQLGFNYHTSLHKNSIFPILNKETIGETLPPFALANIADIRDKGFAAHISKAFKTKYWVRLSAWRTRNTVKKIHASNAVNPERIPIAGFADVSKNLIVGQAAGTIVGIAYLRDAGGNILIDDEGFPIMDETLQIIGDPTPDLHLGWSNKLSFKRMDLRFTIDAQIGGDTWDGTQNVLNYHGVSQITADERDTKNYIFEGQTLSGQNNTKPVDFANPNEPVSNNRWVRYGYAGIAEAAIVDASYVNLQNITFSYTHKRFRNSAFISTINWGVYANNVFSIRSYKHQNPYSSLFDNAAAKNLDYFNAPLLMEFGFHFSLEI